MVRGTVMRFYVFLLWLILMSLIACTPRSNEEELSIAKTYVRIPEAAQDAKALRFSQGQWRTDYVKFSLPENDLDRFLATTCFVSQSEFYSKYPWEYVDMSE